MLCVRLCLASKRKCVFRFRNEPFGVSGVTQFGLCDPIHERVRFDSVGRGAHFVAREASRSRTELWGTLFFGVERLPARR